MKSAKPTNRKKINLKLKDLKTNKDPRGGAKKFSRPSRDGTDLNHNEMFLAEVSQRKEPSKRSNGKTIDLKLKDLTPNKDPRAGVKFSRPGRDGLMTNHNELFLAELS